MKLSNMKRHLTAGFILIIFAANPARAEFPSYADQSTFTSDLKRAALLSNLPNLKGSNHYLGLKLSGASTIFSDGLLAIPDVRLSIYPNPGYNIWTQFSTWPGDTPSFSVGTGAQVVFFNEDGRSEQAIGFSWNTIFGESHRQRDINLHAMYARLAASWEYGMLLILDMHHVILEENIGLNSYDGNMIHFAPYIKLMKNETRHMSLIIPFSAHGMAARLSIEWLLGRRE